MTDLTEQWKKGELSDRWYYVKNEFGNIYPSEYMKECVGINGCVVFGFLNEVSEITEVIDKVPSYEEWKASEKYNKHLEEVIKIYERKDKQHTDDAIAYNELLDENTKLKELLKECKGLFNRSTVDGAEPSNGELIMILTKIEQALGEDE